MICKHNVTPLICLAIFLIQISCNGTVQPVTSLDQKSIIPKPVSVTSTGNRFVLRSEATIAVQGKNERELNRIGEFLSDQLETSTGFKLPVNSAENESDILLLLAPDEKSHLGNEGYELEITKETLKITAGNPEGIFRGVQTLLQLLPVEKDSISAGETTVHIPTGHILDSPVYAYRGSMLDVSRHFFGVEDVKRYIDLISAYKMNVLHLHLSDDQGWRIEIKSWPNLTAHGGSSEIGGGPGGYFTQEDYKQIVQYALDRYVTIVPEIDMPGHTNAALASYPELNCDGKAPELYTGMEVGFSSLCTEKEITYQFVNDVIRELAGLTPGPYIHIGGDESHATPIEDYIPFINRVQGIVQKYGKVMIGWDEVAHADIDSSTIVQFWAVAENATKAVEKGSQVIMSPASKAYLDMKYDSITRIGLDWSGYIEVDVAYQWDPAVLVPGIDKDDIMGIEAPLWTETITDMDEIEYMVFPRILGIAEIGWTPAEDRNWEEYKTRLGEHGKRLEAMGVNYYVSNQVSWGNPASQQE